MERAVARRGRVLATGLLSNLAGDAVFLVRDAVTGALLGMDRIADDWVFTMPDHHLSVATVDRAGYAVVLGKGSSYAIDRLGPEGPARVGWFLPGSSFATGVTLGRIRGRSVVFIWDGDTADAHELETGDHVGRVWTAPDGWLIDKLLPAGARIYAWLVCDDHCWLWDVEADAAVRPPVRIFGLRWGPWASAGRPALLNLVDGRRYEVSDLALGEQIGPPLPATPYDLTMPAVGTLYGRRVLAATDGRLRVWDLLSGRSALDRRLSIIPLALAVGEGGITMVNRLSATQWMPVTPHAIHPLADPTPERSLMRRTR